MALNVLLSLWLRVPLALAGLALANTIATTLEMIVLALLLSRRLGGLEWPQLIATMLKSGAAASAHGRSAVVGSQQLEQCADLAAGACRADRRRACLPGSRGASADARIADRTAAYAGPPIGWLAVCSTAQAPRHPVRAGERHCRFRLHFLLKPLRYPTNRCIAPVWLGATSPPHEAPGPSPGFLIPAHADPRGRDNLPLSDRCSCRYEKLGVLGQIDAVQRQGDAQRLAQLAGPVGQMFVCGARSLSVHGLDAFSGEDAADEHCAGVADRRPSPRSGSGACRR